MRALIALLLLPAAPRSRGIASFMTATRAETDCAMFDAAAAGGPVAVAVGARHRSGDFGVLNLLTRDGWVLVPLP